MEYFFFLFKNRPKVFLTVKKYFSAVTARTTRRVYFSSSQNIFENLALEDYLYQNENFEGQSLLLLWINSPSVVIGRHQNPWIEVNLNELMRKNVAFSRRNSGGGAVYHDIGNLNFTFFSCRSKYSRKPNLEIICNALKRNWNLNVKITDREDIIIQDSYKISGTASKLGHKTAYHHCTLLVDVESSTLSNILIPLKLGVESNATASVRSQTRNIAAINPQITVKDVISAVAHEYLNNDHQHCSLETVQDQITVVTPTESNFPGLNRLRDEFSSWKWIFGKTPPFKVNWRLDDEHQVEFQVHHGVIESVDLSHSGLCQADQKIWSEFLCKRKIDRCMNDMLHHISPNDFENEEVNVNLREFLLSFSAVPG